MPKQLALTKGKFALVDDERYDELNQHKWYAFRAGNTFYAVRNENDQTLGWRKRRHVLMHRVVMNADKTKYPFIDHINHDGLDNRRENLRFVTNRENGQNRKLKGSSKYIGVSWQSARKQWEAQIQVANKTLHLGYFHLESDAARAYDEAITSLGLEPVNFK